MAELLSEVAGTSIQDAAHPRVIVTLSTGERHADVLRELETAAVLWPGRARGGCAD